MLIKRKSFLICRIFQLSLILSLCIPLFGLGQNSGFYFEFGVELCDSQSRIICNRTIGPEGFNSFPPPRDLNSIDPRRSLPNYYDHKRKEMDLRNDLGDIRHDLESLGPRFSKIQKNLDRIERRIDEQLKELEKEGQDSDQVNLKKEEALKEEGLEETTQVLDQERLKRDELISIMTGINPGDPGWDKIRDFTDRWLDVRETLLEEPEKFFPHYEASELILSAVEGFILSASSFYINSKIEKGDEYIQLGSIVLDQVLEPDPNFSLKNHLDVISDIPITEWDYQFQMEGGEEKQKLIGVYNDLFKFEPFSLRGDYTKEIGIRAAQLADQAYIQGDQAEGELAIHIAETMLDLTLSFTPFVGWGKDIFEAISGRNLVTGRKLDSTERLLAAVGSVTLGYGEKIGKLIQEIYSRGRIIGVFLKKVSKDGYSELRTFIKSAAKYSGIRNAEDFKGYARIYENLKGFKKATNLEVENIRVGRGNKIALIGRNRGEKGGPTQRVLEAKKYFEKKGMGVEIFDDEVAREQFNAMTKGKRLKPEDLRDTPLYKNNKRWIERITSEDYTVLDLGQGKIKTKSDFYEMEKKIVFLNSLD